MTTKSVSQIGSGSPLISSFEGVLKRYASIMEVLPPYKEGGALRVNLKGKLPLDEWKTFAYKGGIFTARFGREFTYYVKADKASETVAQLQSVGVSIPDVDYKGKAIVEAKVEAKKPSKKASKTASTAETKEMLSLIRSAVLEVLKEKGIN